MKPLYECLGAVTKFEMISLLTESYFIWLDLIRAFPLQLLLATVTPFWLSADDMCKSHPLFLLSMQYQINPSLILCFLVSFPATIELIIPADANVFYAMNTAAQPHFLLRKKVGDGEESSTSSKKKSVRGGSQKGSKRLHIKRMSWVKVREEARWKVKDASLHL